MAEYVFPNVSLKNILEKIKRITRKRVVFRDAAKSSKVLPELKVQVSPQLHEIDFYDGKILPDREYVPQTSQAIRILHRGRVTSQLKRVDLFELFNGFEQGQITFTGPTGSGKTTLLQAIARDVLDGKFESLKQIEIVLFIECRDIRCNSEQDPADILFQNFDLTRRERQEAYEWAKNNPDKILLVIDSLDTYPHKLEEERPITGSCEKGTSSQILASLLSGKALPGCRCITSSREYTIRNYKGDLRAKKVIRLGGLTHDGMKQIIDGYLGVKEGRQVWDFLETNSPILISLCSTPVFLVFTLIGLKSNLGFKPTNMSGIMVLVIQSLIRSDHARVEDLMKIIDKLKKISFVGTSEGRVLFLISELASYDLEEKDITDLAVITKGNQTRFLESHNHYLFFSHQSLQETFTAFRIAEMEPELFEKFLEDSVHTPQLAVVRRILTGIILNEEVHPQCRSFWKCTPADLQQKRKILKYSLEKQLDNKVVENTDRLELLISFHEAGESMRDIVRSSVREINLQDLSLTPGDTQAIGSIVCMAERLKKLWLISCNIDATSLRVLLSYVESSRVMINFLDLSFNIVKPDRDVIAMIAKLLSHVEEELWLRGWDVAAENRKILQEKLNRMETGAKVIFDFNDEISKQSGSKSEERPTNEQIAPNLRYLATHGCEVIIPAQTNGETARSTLTTAIESEECPDDYIAISSTITLKPPVSSDEPLTARITTWCSTNSPIPIEILGKDDEDSPWTPIAHKILNGNQRTIEFDRKVLHKAAAFVKKSNARSLVYAMSIGLYFHPTGTFVAALRVDDLTVREKYRKQLANGSFKPTNVMTDPINVPQDKKVALGLSCRDPKNITFLPSTRLFEVTENFEKKLYQLLMFDIDPLPNPNQHLQLTYSIDGNDIDFHHTWPKKNPRRESNTKVIGDEGGSLAFRQCAISMHPGAVEDPTPFSLSTEIDPRDFQLSNFQSKLPKGKMEEKFLTISPTVVVQPSGQYKQQIKVTLQVWCSPVSGEQRVQIMKREDGEEEWAKFTEVVQTQERTVEFYCDHFTGFKAVLQRMLFGRLKFHVSFALFYNQFGKFNLVVYKNDETVETRCNNLMLQRKFKLAPVFLNPMTVQEEERMEMRLQIRDNQDFEINPDQTEVEVDEDFGNDQFQTTTFQLQPLPLFGQQISLAIAINRLPQQAVNNHNATEFIMPWEFQRPQYEAEPEEGGQNPNEDQADQENERMEIGENEDARIEREDEAQPFIPDHNEHNPGTDARTVNVIVLGAENINII